MHRAQALANPWGYHHKWNEALYRFARRRPQLTRGPTACGHRRFEHLASCAYAARPLCLGCLQPYTPGCILAWTPDAHIPCTRPPDVDLLKLRSYFLSQLGPRYARMLKLPMYSEGHILSAPGLLATFFEELLIRRALPLSASSGPFSFILSILW